jgi:dTDP-4-amino-4,6-dideoxygalactose transaminase
MRYTGYWSFVFNGNKIFTSGGGAIVTRNEELKDKSLFFLRLNPETTLLTTSEVGAIYRMSNILCMVSAAVKWKF